MNLFPEVRAASNIYGSLYSYRQFDHKRLQNERYRMIKYEEKAANRKVNLQKSELKIKAVQEK